MALAIGINIAYSRAMSFPFDIPSGSPLVAIEAWTPDDLVQFAHRAAAGLDSSMLAQVSAIEEQAVEALLAEPVIAALVEEYGRMLEMSDEEFRARLRPVVRMVVEHEVRKPKPKGPFLFFLFFCLDIRGDDPVHVVIDNLLRSLRRKRGKPGFGRSRRRDAPCDPHEPAKFTPVLADAAPRPRLESGLSRNGSETSSEAVEPTEKELLAESMVRFANRGRRILALKIAEELADRVEAGTVRRPPTQQQTIEKKDVKTQDKVIEGCGDRVDPHFYPSSSASFTDRQARALDDHHVAVCPLPDI